MKRQTCNKCKKERHRDARQSVFDPNDLPQNMIYEALLETKRIVMKHRCFINSWCLERRKKITSVTFPLFPLHCVFCVPSTKSKKMIEVRCFNAFRPTILEAQMQGSNQRKSTREGFGGHLKVFDCHLGKSFLAKAQRKAKQKPRKEKDKQRKTKENTTVCIFPYFSLV